MKSLVLLSALLQSPPTTNSQAPASIEGIVVDKLMHPVVGVASSTEELQLTQIPATRN